jgi:hypothetical protein
MEEFHEIIANWTNQHNTSYNSRFIAACAACENYKDQGFDKRDAAELLMANGFGNAGVDEVVNKTFGETKETIQKKSMELFVVPTNYNDIKPLVEYRLITRGPEKFVSYLTDAPEPIITTTAKHKKSLIKLATAGYENKNTLDFLHKEISPYMEEAMLNSVLLSERDAGEIHKVSGTQYKVTLGQREATVDLDNGVSSGHRFAKGNFSKFGLADEFLIKAHDQVSPYIRLRKILLSK